MKKRMSLAGVSWILLASAFALLGSVQAKSVEASHGRIAVLAGISANVWNAECYYDATYNPSIWPTCAAGYTHAGGYSGGSTTFDIGNGNPDHWVFMQLDYLPSNVSGGWVHAYNVSDGCAAYDVSSPYWNGRKLVVEFWFYDTSGQPITWAGVVYQHVDTERLTPNTWYSWNNPYSSTPLFGSPNYTLNDLRNGGVLVADVAANGASSGGCSSNEHVHMEGNFYSDYDYNRYYNEGVTDRWNDIFYYHQPYINGGHS